MQFAWALHSQYYNVVLYCWISQWLNALPKEIFAFLIISCPCKWETKVCTRSAKFLESRDTLITECASYRLLTQIKRDLCVSDIFLMKSCWIAQNKLLYILAVFFADYCKQNYQVHASRGLINNNRIWYNIVTPASQIETKMQRKKRYIKGTCLGFARV